MRLYYYTAKQWGIKSLWEKRLKISRYSELNDPFELRPYKQYVTPNEISFYDAVYNALSRIHGILCFSDHWNINLMWAHYGDKHKGMVLGFDIADSDALTKISYTDIRTSEPEYQYKSDQETLTQEYIAGYIAHCLSHKHSAWSYEREYRLRAEIREEVDGISYYSFGPGLQPREVIIGSRCSLTYEDVQDALSTNFGQDHAIEIFKAVPSPLKFEMSRTNNVPRRKLRTLDIIRPPFTTPTTSRSN